MLVHMVKISFSFARNCQTLFQGRLYHFAFLPAMNESSCCSRSLGAVSNLNLCSGGASLVAQMVKNLPAMWEMWVQSLGQEDPLEKGMISPTILVLRISKTEEPGRLQSMWPQRL